MDLVAQKCRACNKIGLRRLFKVGHITVTGYVVPDLKSAKSEPSFDLTVLMCDDCKLVQLEGEDYIDILVHKVYSQYQSTYSLSLWVQEYMRNLLRKIHEQHRIGEREVFLEIGCNDGGNLEMVRELPCKVLGVEPSSNLVKLCRERDIPVIEEFFDRDVGVQIAKKHGFPRVILVRHLLEHVFDLQGFVQGLRACMDSRSILVIEVPYTPSILQGFHFEGIAHVHLSYFSLGPLQKLLSAVGISLISAEQVPTDGGSILVQAQLQREQQVIEDSINELLLMERALKIHTPEPYQLLEHRIREHRSAVVNLLKLLREENKRIYGFGAGKGHTILTTFGLDTSVVECVIDDAEWKQGMFLPGCGIQVRPPSYLVENPPDYLLMLAPTHAEELKSKISSRFPGRRFRFIDIIPQIDFERK